jgi:glucokinase
MSHVGNSKSQHKINESLIFNYLLRHGPSYKTQVAEALCISLPAISRVFDSLYAAGFIEEDGIRRSPNGRSVPYYRVAIKNGFIIGVDILKKKLAIKLLGADHDLRIKDLIYNPENIADCLKQSILNAVDEMIVEGKLKSLDDLKAVCLGSPGIVDVETGEIRNAVFHKELNHVNVKPALEAVLKKPVLVDNVVKLSAFAEYRKIEEEQKKKNILCIDLGFEIGVGIIIDGRVFRGTDCTAGEIGFARTAYDEEKPLSTLYAKTHSFVWLCAKADELLDIKSPYDDYSSKDESLRAVIQLFEYAINGNKIARSIILEYVRKLAVFINNLYVVLDPDSIFLSGDICVIPGTKELIIDPLHEAISKISYFKPPEIRVSEYGTNSALIGACDIAFDTYIKTEFPYFLR